MTQPTATQAGALRVLRDRDVPRAMLTSDDPSIGRLVVTHVGSAERILDALHRLEAADGERPRP